MKRTQAWLVILSTLLLSCRSETQQDPTHGAAQGDIIVAEGSIESDGSAIPTSTAESSAPVAPTSAESSGGNQPLPQGNQLTAAEFSDALNIDVFLRFVESRQVPLNVPTSSVIAPDMTRDQWLALVPPVNPTPHSKVEIALVLDVTGSMGDELRYLQAEWNVIIGDLQTLYPELLVRLSLIAYRDVGDSFVTAAHAFTEDRTAFQSDLMKYSAGGGGDYPEAADQALQAASQFSWGDASSSKLLFWLADAPPHADKEDETIDAILHLREKGVKLYPIAASGVADEAEKIMRIGALVTGGSYLFLTNDSGIGNSHAEPHIPCYNVERLNQLLQRIIAEQVTGQKIAPSAENIMRRVGNMQNGVCQPAQP